jgi:hypothetical protein
LAPALVSALDRGALARCLDAAVAALLLEAADVPADLVARVEPWLRALGGEDPGRPAL